MAILVQRVKELVSQANYIAFSLYMALYQNVILVYVRNANNLFYQGYEIYLANMILQRTHVRFTLQETQQKKDKDDARQIQWTGEYQKLANKNNYDVICPTLNVDRVDKRVTFIGDKEAQESDEETDKFK